MIFFWPETFIDFAFSIRKVVQSTRAESYFACGGSLGAVQGIIYGVSLLEHEKMLSEQAACNNVSINFDVFFGYT